MNISPWTIYWVMQLDSIGNALSVLFVMLLLIVIMSFFLGVMFKANPIDEEQEEWGKFLISAVKKIAPVTLILFLILTFVPDTKTVAAMIVIPAIANNENIQGESVEIYNLAKEAMREMVNSKEKGK